MEIRFNKVKYTVLYDAPTRVVVDVFSSLDILEALVPNLFREGAKGIRIMFDEGIRDIYNLKEFDEFIKEEKEKVRNPDYKDLSLLNGMMTRLRGLNHMTINSGAMGCMLTSQIETIEEKIKHGGDVRKAYMRDVKKSQ